MLRMRTLGSCCATRDMNASSLHIDYFGGFDQEKTTNAIWETGKSQQVSRPSLPGRCLVRLPSIEPLLSN